jgi:hypothetical protein
MEAQLGRWIVPSSGVPYGGELALYAGGSKYTGPEPHNGLSRVRLNRCRRQDGFLEMKLLDEIISLSTEDKDSVSVLLRKFLILAYQLKNERLKGWVKRS